ncbi:MAG: hypothetical protein RR063_09155, partial [Anaerovoracaceae bacterium]
VSDVESKTNNEFGTLTAIITESVVGGRKTVNYSSKTTKNVPTLIAEVEVVLYATGTPISSQEKATSYDLTFAGYYWECHSATNNTKRMSVYGSHEARGQGALGINTAIINF